MRFSFRTLALAAYCLALLAALPPAWVAVRDHVASAARYGGEDSLTARRRWNRDYADGVEAIRRAIPLDGEYLLVYEKAYNSIGLLVQYDLAPRRAWYFDMHDTKADLLARGRPPGAPPFVVVVREANQAPLLLAIDELFPPRAGP